MKYKKGTFVVVPNIDILAGKKTELQSIFMWLCSYSNDDGQCYPSRKALASKSGLTVKTVDKYLAELVSLGLISKTPRLKIGTYENTSNLYQINIPDLVLYDKPVYVTDTHHSVSNIPTSSHPNDPVTIPSINYTNLTNTQPEVVPVKVKEIKPFSFKEEMQKLIDSKWKPHKIIWLYFTKKKFNFDNEKQFKAEYGRCLKSARELEGYNSQQIEQTMNKMDELGLTWTLNAIGRNISNVINAHK